MMRILHAVSSDIVHMGTLVKRCNLLISAAAGRSSMSTSLDDLLSCIGFFSQEDWHVASALVLASASSSPFSGPVLHTSRGIFSLNPKGPLDPKGVFLRLSLVVTVTQSRFRLLQVTQRCQLPRSCISSWCSFMKR